VALDKNVKVLVIGAGAMGAGIAHVAALAGHPVYLYDTRTEAIDKGLGGIAQDLDFLVSKGKLDSAAREATMARLTAVTDLDAASDAGLAIEAIVESRSSSCSSKACSATRPSLPPIRPRCRLPRWAQCWPVPSALPACTSSILRRA
jgi:glycerol-3-phosphate dehydrogenase